MEESKNGSASAQTSSDINLPGLVGDHAPPVKGIVELHDLNKASL